MTEKQNIIEIAKKAKIAAASLKSMDANTIDIVLRSIALSLKENSNVIQDVNFQDILEGQKQEMSLALLDRLTIDENVVNSMIKGVEVIIEEENPLDKVLEENMRPNGLLIKKVVVPIGVIGIIYESRPNVTVDAASICIKSGNAVILRGGKEAINSNKILVKIIRAAILKHEVFWGQVLTG